LKSHDNHNFDTAFEVDRRSFRSFWKVRAELPEGKQVVGSPERHAVLEIPETKVKAFEHP